MHPKIKFKSDYKKDIKTFSCFVRDAKYDNGRTLEWAIFRKYHSLKKYKINKTIKIKPKEIELFVKNIYQKNKSLIKNNLSVHKTNWRKKEKTFYALVKKLFQDKFWPKGKYIAYPTIWGMFPRFLNDKTFQIPYKHKNKEYVNVVIAHEILHFIFYNYFFKKYPKYKNDKFSFLVWHISEIFNSIIQNSPQWLKIFKNKLKTYPEHKKIIAKLKGKYHRKEGWQTDDLITDILKIVNATINY